jgi:hypothetical protein
VHISFAIFADSANLSQEGKLNVLGVFDAVQVAGLPTVHPRTHFVVRLKANAEDAGNHTLAFRWLNPMDQELWTSGGEMTVAATPHPSFEVDLPIIAVVDLPLNAVGQYRMEVLLDGTPTAEARLIVSGPGGPQPQMMAPPAKMFS